MIRISQNFDNAVLKEGTLVLYGYGKWGKKCLKYLEERQIAIDAICDRRYQDYINQDIQKKHMFISPEQLQDKRDVMVLIAVERFEDILLWVGGFTKNIFVFWNDNNIIYKIESDCEILGCKTNNELEDLLREQKKIALIGNIKHREDFKYIFDNIEINMECDRWNASDDNYDLVIWCDRIDERYEGISVEAKDLFVLLMGSQCDNLKPYVMMLQTYYAPMVEQPFCSRPFTHAVINSNCEFHFCCGDWSLGVQNILKQTDLQNIWNSIEAKIYRLSMINRTYSFCRWGRCVYLQANPKKNNELIRFHMEPKEIPDSLEIGIDKTCNLFCESCRECVIVEIGKRKENIERAKSIIENSEWLEKCKTILLGGQGEVFFSPVYRELMYQANKKRKTLDLRTNGILLSEGEFDKLREIYCELRIIVSIDAATKQTYDKLRRSNDPYAWEKLNHNLKMLSERRSCGVLNFFQINMCVQKKNYAEIPEFISMGETLGVDKIYLTPIRNWGTYSEEEFDKIQIFNENKVLKPEVKKVIEGLRNEQRKMQIEIAF